MRLEAILREAVRNIVTGTTRFTTFCVLLSLTIGGLVLADAATIAQHVAEANTFRTAGGATEILTAEGRVSPAACEALAGIPSVIAAGALRSAPAKVTITALPDAPVPAYEVSPGFARVISAEHGGGRGTLVSHDLAHTLGVQPGASVATDQGDLPIASTFRYPSDGRRPGFGYSVLSFTNDDRDFDECWVAVWPQVTNIRSLLLTAVQPGEGDSSNRPQISQLNSSHGQSFAGHTVFLERLTQAATPAVAFIAIGLGSLSVRLRRLQLASALHAGTTKLDLLITQLSEAGAWSTVAAVIGLGFAASATGMVPDIDRPALFRSLSGALPAGIAGALVGACVAVLCSSEKHLFRYFKDR